MGALLELLAFDDGAQEHGDGAHGGQDVVGLGVDLCMRE